MLELVALSLETKLKGRGLGGRQKDSDRARVGGAKAKDGPDEDGVLHLGGSFGVLDWEEVGKNKPKKPACCSLTPAKWRRCNVVDVVAATAAAEAARAQRCRRRKAAVRAGC